jgi:pSer/pThr/pTyr-binding forkhead associated (FHA) protein
VAALHARLAQGPDGGFTLTDEKSAAGTWVNFEQIDAPRLLLHGDVFHIGQVSYRFMLRTPPEKAGPRLTPVKK